MQSGHKYRSSDATAEGIGLPELNCRLPARLFRLDQRLRRLRIAADVPLERNAQRLAQRFGALYKAEPALPQPPVEGSHVRAEGSLGARITAIGDAKPRQPAPQSPAGRALTHRVCRRRQPSQPGATVRGKTGRQPSAEPQRSVARRLDRQAGILRIQAKRRVAQQAQQVGRSRLVARQQRDAGPGPRRDSQCVGVAGVASGKRQSKAGECPSQQRQQLGVKQHHRMVRRIRGTRGDLPGDRCGFVVG